jgi:uncharacterized membrane protein
MNTQKILVAGLIGGIFSFLLGWLVFGILMKGMGPAGMACVHRPEGDFVYWAIILSNLLYGIFLSYIFVQWASISTLQRGIVAGAIFGFFTCCTFDFGFYAMTTMYTIKDILMDIVINTIFSGLIGGVIGWWLGRGAKS